MTLRIVEDAKVKGFLARVYAYLGLDVLLTASISYYIAQNYKQFLFLYPTGINSVIIYGVLLYASLHFLQKSLIDVNSSWATVLLLLISFLTIEGILFAPFMIIFSEKSILLATGISGGILLIMSLFGYYTKLNLSNYFSIFLVGTFAISITEIVALFIFKFPINLQITSIGIVVCFLFFIALDVQNFKELYYRYVGDVNSINKLALLGSIMLFTDFIVILQRLLIIMNDRKKN